MSFAPFPALPYGVHHHCLLSLGNGGDLLLVGGFSVGRSREAHKFSASDNNWKRVADMPTPSFGIDILTGSDTTESIISIL